MKNSYS